MKVLCDRPTTPLFTGRFPLRRVEATPHHEPLNHSVLNSRCDSLGGESPRERVNHPFMLRFTRQFNSVVKFTGRITGVVIAPVNGYVNVWIPRSRCGSPGNSTVAVWITGRFPCRVNCPANRPVNWVRGVFQMIHWVIRLVIHPPREYTTRFTTQ